MRATDLKASGANPNAFKNDIIIMQLTIGLVFLILRTFFFMAKKIIFSRTYYINFLIKYEKNATSLPPCY